MASKREDNRKRKTTVDRRSPDGPCLFCRESRQPSYQDPEALSRFISDRGKIVGRTRSGVCAKHQRRLSKAVKRARHLALLPFTLKPR